MHDGFQHFQGCFNAFILRSTTMVYWPFRAFLQWQGLTRVLLWRVFNHASNCQAYPKEIPLPILTWYRWYHLLSPEAASISTPLSVHPLHQDLQQCLPDWCVARIKLVRKKDDPSSPSNFRPIALTMLSRNYSTKSSLLPWVLLPVESDYWIHHLKRFLRVVNEVMSTSTVSTLSSNVLKRITYMYIHLPAMTLLM